MLAQAPTPVIGGALFVLLGLVLVVWVLRNRQTQNRKVVLIHLSLCPLPFVVTVLSYRSYQLGFSTPGAIVSTSTLMVVVYCGMVGTLFGFLSAILAIMQLRRIDSSE